MNKNNWYFRQKVSEGELDSAFNSVELAIENFVQSFQYVGIGIGADVTQAVVPNLTVLASGPAIIYDQNFKKIAWAPNISINCALDENGSSTAVTLGGQEKWLSIFAEFQTVQSDPRVDGNGNTVFFAVTESYRINVAQGAQAAIGVATRPPLRASQILLADVRLINLQTQILNADIDKAPSATSRTQVIYDITGSPLILKTRSVQDALSSMLAAVNNITTNAALLAATQAFTGVNTFAEKLRLTHADASLGLDEPRISLEEASIPRKFLLVETKVQTAPDRYARAYFAGVEKAIVFTYNAKYTTTDTWVSDSTATDAYKIEIGLDGNSGIYFNKVEATLPASWQGEDWSPIINPGLASKSVGLSFVGLEHASLASNEPVINVYTSAEDDASGDNQKLIAKWKASSTAGGVFGRLFSCDGTGTNSTVGFIFTLNADWDAATASWTADDNTLSALGMRSVYGSGVANTEILAKSVTTVDWLDASGWDNVETTNPGLIGALRISGVIGLRQTRSRVATAYGGAITQSSFGAGTLVTNGVTLNASGGAVTAHIPIKIPERATLKRVRVDITPVSGVAVTLNIYKSTLGTFGSSGPTVSLVDSGTTAGAARQVLDTGSFTSVADISDISYFAEIQLNATDYFQGIEVTWEYDELPEQFPPV
jgi:hypothetical protein